MALSSRAQRDIDLWKKWKANPTNENRNALLKAVDPIINSEIMKQSGTIPLHTLKLKAKVLVIKALPKYNPSKSQLNTFIVNNLKPLRRANMRAQNVVRMPENMQLKVRTFLDAKQELEEKYSREPTVHELSDHLSWPITHVTRMNKQLRTSAPSSSLTYSGAVGSQDSDLDLKADLVYRSLAPRDRLIFEFTTGYGGKDILSNNAIASKLKVSAAYVSQRKNYIKKQLKKAGV